MHDGRTEQRVARRARILLAMADPDTVVRDLAEHFGLDRTSIWSLCRRYVSVRSSPGCRQTRSVAG